MWLLKNSTAPHREEALPNKYSPVLWRSVFVSTNYVSVLLRLLILHRFSMPCNSALELN